MSKGIDEAYIAGLGYVRSYANVKSTPPTTPPIDPGVPSFQKSLFGDSAVNAIAEEVKKSIKKSKKAAKKLAAVQVSDVQQHKTAEDEASNSTDELEPGDDDESIDGQPGDTEMAEPNSNRVDDVEDTTGDADTKMAQPNSKRVPKVKPSDAPEGPDYPGKPNVGGGTGAGLPTERRKSITPFDRETRVYVHKAHLAGTVRRISSDVGAEVPEYAVALDNGNVMKALHTELMPMTQAEASRQS